MFLCGWEKDVVDEFDVDEWLHFLTSVKQLSCSFTAQYVEKRERPNVVDGGQMFDVC